MLLKYKYKNKYVILNGFLNLKKGIALTYGEKTALMQPFGHKKNVMNRKKFY